MTLWCNMFAEEDGATISEARHEMAELMACIRL
jgi:hypothetical protein